MAGVDLERRRAIELTGLVAAGSVAALAGCADEGPGDEDADGEQPAHPDEVGGSDGGGGGPIDEENETGGAPDNDSPGAPDEDDEDDEGAG